MEVRVPGFGHGLEEALLIEWVAGVGDRIERGDVVALVETDKASTEIVAERGGLMAGHSAAVGTILRPGEPLYRLAADQLPGGPDPERARHGSGEGR